MDGVLHLVKFQTKVSLIIKLIGIIRLSVKEEGHRVLNTKQKNQVLGRNMDLTSRNKMPPLDKCPPPSEQFLFLLFRLQHLQNFRNLIRFLLKNCFVSSTMFSRFSSYLFSQFNSFTISYLFNFLLFYILSQIHLCLCNQYIWKYRLFQGF